MKLRTKTFLVIGVTTLLLVAALFAVSWLFLLQNFSKVEVNHARRSVQQSNDILSREYFNFSTMAYDWGMWDDTYNFVMDGNKEFIDTNITASVFVPLRVNLVMFINTNNEVVLSQGFDLKAEEAIFPPEDIKDYLKAGSPLLSYTETDGVSGIVTLLDGPMIVVTKPILTSSGEGPVHGIVLMGRYLDTEEVARLAEIANHPLTVKEYSSSGMPEDFRQARSVLLHEPMYITPLNQQLICGYTVIKDLYGNPALIMRSDMTRDIYMEGRRSIMYFMIFTVFAGVIFGVVILLIVDRFIISRLAKLGGNVKKIGQSGDISQRVHVESADEVSELGKMINGMLALLQQSQDKLRQAQEDIKGRDIELSKQKTEITERERKMSELKSKIESLNERMLESQKRMSEMGSQVGGMGSAQKFSVSEAEGTAESAASNEVTPNPSDTSRSAPVPPDQPQTTDVE